MLRKFRRPTFSAALPRDGARGRCIPNKLQPTSFTFARGAHEINQSAAASTSPPVAASACLAWSAVKPIAMSCSACIWNCAATVAVVAATGVPPAFATIFAWAGVVADEPWGVAACAGQAPGGAESATDAPPPPATTPEPNVPRKPSDRTAGEFCEESTKPPL
eukprot:CAMPEP_0117481634 /NCGR_PEP_ID=MMETSP0784-20121206/13000_1 /TAXON_ID=39447 /ORGANISM="" /LENGTH=162 /DNA_ID=CAMNT_0005276095 /DNA_START=225 /DNA_END=713 /DNA_ORIENTATION=+